MSFTAIQQPISWTFEEHQCVLSAVALTGSVETGSGTNAATSTVTVSIFDGDPAMNSWDIALWDPTGTNSLRAMAIVGCTCESLQREMDCIDGWERTIALESVEITGPEPASLTRLLAQTFLAAGAWSDHALVIVPPVFECTGVTIDDVARALAVLGFQWDMGRGIWVGSAATEGERPTLMQFAAQHD
jgi:hypothetical protein